jgi:hypothetical protein
MMVDDKEKSKSHEVPEINIDEPEVDILDSQPPPPTIDPDMFSVDRFYYFSKRALRGAEND